MSTSPQVTKFPVAKNSRKKTTKNGQKATFAPELIAGIDARPKKSAAVRRKAQVVPGEPKQSPAAVKTIPARISQLTRALLRGCSWLGRNYSLSATKNLRVTETAPLGEKRFVAVIQVDGQRFLIGGGTQGVSLLTQLRDLSSSPGGEV